mmetsp:Transcript_3347/g.4586  ORF Transcript_3347/g.4586 Transcript_3347/m.4586 type:complete len:98 (+) Transcript_3347:637-930(+)
MSMTRRVRLCDWTLAGCFWPLLTLHKLTASVSPFGTSLIIGDIRRPDGNGAIAQVYQQSRGAGSGAALGTSTRAATWLPASSPLPLHSAHLGKFSED